MDIQRQPQGSLTFGEVETDLVPGPVQYATLTPTPEVVPHSPLLVWLHGGGSSLRFLETCRPQFTQAWAERSLPPMVVATPSAGWSFYLDSHDGGELWETFLLTEFISEVRRATGLADGPVLIGGVSIGALGALRMGLKHPDRFKVITALEPTLEAALSWDRVQTRDRVYMPPGLRRRLFGQPIDHQYWRANHPTAIAVANSPAIAASGTAIYLDVGDRDRLHIHHGVEMLHRCLFDVGISHEYRVSRGADHVGPSIGPRILDSLRFIGRSLRDGYRAQGGVDGLVELDRFDREVTGLEQRHGFRSTLTVRSGQVDLTVHAQGGGAPVVLLASLGRGADDFADLADRLADAGYRVLRPEPRGWSGSSRALASISLRDLADDVAAMIAADGRGPATLVGHGFGGTVARAAASRHPALVASMVLLATPGPDRPPPEPLVARRRAFVSELPMEERLEAIALAYFADGNDPVVWLEGWHPLLASAQMEAEQRTPPDQWAGGGVVDTLILRPAHDRLVTADSTRKLANELAGKASVVEIPGAGHALLPEQPEAVAVAVLTWLGRHRWNRTGVHDPRRTAIQGR